jgi:hypothetical protein
MIDHQPNKKKVDNSLLWKYAGFATQLTVALVVSVYAGMKLDSLFKFKKTIIVWALPLLIILVLIYKVIKDTAPKK